MSAQVEVSEWQWWCEDCAKGEEGFDFKRDAQDAANRHDKLNHELGQI